MRTVPILFYIFSAGAAFSIALTNAGWIPAFVLWVFFLITKRDKFRWIKSPMDIPILIFLLTGILSSIFGLDIFSSANRLRKESMVLIFFLLANNLSQEGIKKKVLTIFLIFSLFSAGLGIFQKMFGIDIGDTRGVTNCPEILKKLPPKMIDFLATHNGRSDGTRSHPLTFAEGLLVALGFTLAFFIEETGKKKWKWLIAILFLGLGIVFSKGRGPLIGLVAVFLIVDIFRRKRFFPLSILLLLPLVFFIFHNAKKIIKLQDSSALYRVHIWKTGIKIWKDYPLFGVGPGNIGKVYWDYRDPEYSKTKDWYLWTEMHSNFLQVLVERGIIGLASFLFLIGWSFYRTLVRYKRLQTDEEFDHARILGSLAAQTGIIFSGFTESNFNDSEILIDYWFVLALGL